MGIKDIRRSFILERAIKIFCNNSISEVKIKDVAAYCNIGEATFYRYFSKKTALIVACAVKLQEKVAVYFGSDQEGRGFDRLSRFYYRFFEIFSEHSEYYRFLSEFDSYCIREGVDDLDSYSGGLDVFKAQFEEAYRAGLEDGSVKAVYDLDLFYYSTTHALLSLGKKLASEAYIVRQDDLTDKRQEIRTVIEVVLQYLKKE
ncbi:MAG: TetR/AcrR family transcriptional regulator [Clostridia bacterium]|nr:TetR/AcrR family transcriptional regulator [Clostridia bacterium]